MNRYHFSTVRFNLWISSWQLPSFVHFRTDSEQMKHCVICAANQSTFETRVFVL